MPLARFSVIVFCKIDSLNELHVNLHVIVEQA
jgi:hypothetical protein